MSPDYQMLMELERVDKVLGQCDFRDWDLLLKQDGDRLYVQVRFVDRCANTGKITTWLGRKWFLSLHMTDSEIIQTAFKAVLTAVEHEARESFKYKGRAIFGPHFDVDALWEICDDKHVDVRKTA